jgi:hypothetical protein
MRAVILLTACKRVSSFIAARLKASDVKGLSSVAGMDSFSRAIKFATAGNASADPCMIVYEADAETVTGETVDVA